MGLRSLALRETLFSEVRSLSAFLQLVEGCLALCLSHSSTRTEQSERQQMLRCVLGLSGSSAQRGGSSGGSCGLWCVPEYLLEGILPSWTVSSWQLVSWTEMVKVMPTVQCRIASVDGPVLCQASGHLEVDAPPPPTGLRCPPVQQN